MEYRELQQIKTKIGKQLAKEYFRHSEKHQNEEIKRIYWNIANRCDDNDAGSAGAREAVYEMQHRPKSETPRDIRQNWKVHKALNTFLNRRQTLLDRAGIQVSIGA